MSENELATTETGNNLPANPGLYGKSPKDLVVFATETANVLADVINKQRMFKDIQGKKHVLVEGWNTLGSMLGISARERRTERLEDGSYIAYVDLIQMSNQKVIGGASALCSVDERRWSNADEYARRSMAITRATGKAFRLNFSWIMGLAGYEATPAEEMDVIEVETEPLSTSTYIGSKEQQEELKKKLKEAGIKEASTALTIHKKLMGCPIDQMDGMIAAFAKEQPKVENSDAQET